MKWVIPGILLTVSACPASADDFQNSYVRFSLPNGWTCDLDHTEFVCDPPHLPNQPRSAIMILTAKIAGPDDTLTAYIEHLNAEARAKGPGAMIQAPKYSLINGVNWVDCTIEGSEVKNYRTRYLAVNTLETLDDWKK